MTKRIYTALLNVAFFAALSVLAVACSDDDEKVDCEATMEQIDAKSMEFVEAYLNEDCDKIKSSGEELTNLYKKGKNCEEVKAAAEDDGYDSVDDMIEEWEWELDLITDDCQ